jgi:uncharacterized protein
VGTKLSKKLQTIVVSFIAIFAIIMALLVGLSAHFYNVVAVPAHKSFLKYQPISKKSPLYRGEKWYYHILKEQYGTSKSSLHKGKKSLNHHKKLVYFWKQKSATDHLNLVANYVPATKKTNKSIVIAHGFMSDKDQMAAYVYMFHQMGYNVLTPDARGQGQSEGTYIGYGWPDRLDYIKWIKRLIKHTGSNAQIAMFGVSMGGSATMMVSGEHDVPHQVKAYIEDSGYTSAIDEIDYQAGKLYHMGTFPKWPLIPALNAMNKVKSGFDLNAASALRQVRKNHHPMLFIHGQADRFVPTRMVYPLYHASQGPKQLLVVKGAPHAGSYLTNPSLYMRTINKFLHQYLK